MKSPNRRSQSDHVECGARPRPSKAQTWAHRSLTQKLHVFIQLAIFPQKNYKIPQNFTKIPQKFTKIPQNFTKILQNFKNSSKFHNFTIPQNFELKLGTRNKCGGNKFLCTCSYLFHSAAYQLDQKIAFFETPPPKKKKKIKCEFVVAGWWCGVYLPFGERQFIGQQSALSGCQVTLWGERLLQLAALLVSESNLAAFARLPPTGDRRGRCSAHQPRGTALSGR